MKSIEEVAVSECEATLNEIKEYYRENDCWQSEIELIDRMLERQLELREAYLEIHAKLGSVHKGIDRLFDKLLGAADLWSPEAVRESYSQKRELEELNARIAKAACNLSLMLQERDEKHNSTDFYSHTLYSNIEAIIRAGKGNWFFESFVENRVSKIDGEFSSKYWPTIPQVIQAIGRDASDARVQPSDEVTAAAIRGTRRSKADFFKAYFRMVEAEGYEREGTARYWIALTDKSIATLANCILDLAENDIVDAQYVKTVRHRYESEN
jgi:hypothetical protein